eukprot:SAG11_NODE_3997_length_2115_cov_1.295139_1_plen_70_part_10
MEEGIPPEMLEQGSEQKREQTATQGVTAAPMPILSQDGHRCALQSAAEATWVPYANRVFFCRSVAFIHSV